MATAALRRLLTSDEFIRMSEAEILGREERLELANGEIIEMSPIGARHHACVMLLVEAFSRLGDRAHVSAQGPLSLPPHNLRYPDVALLRRRQDYYLSAVPTARDVLLVVEVGDTTVAADREEKVPLYAAGGIPEAWTVDLPANRVEIYRRPRGDGYQERRVVAIEESITTEAFPDLVIALAPVRS
jgi:Uma2 family endonuclease